jgi:hypothetical protein
MGYILLLYFWASPDCGPYIAGRNYYSSGYQNQINIPIASDTNFDIVITIHTITDIRYGNFHRCIQQLLIIFLS